MQTVPKNDIIGQKLIKKKELVPSRSNDIFMMNILKDDFFIIIQ